MAKAIVVPVWQRAVIVMASTVVGVVVVSCLYWAQKVFIPVALAVFLTFLLAPIVTALQRRHLGRMPSVLLVVLLAALTLGGILWLVTAEVTSLAADTPTYTKNINGKIRTLRQMSHGSVLEGLDKMIQDVIGEWGSQPENPATTERVIPDPKRPTTVVVQAESPAWMSRLPALFMPMVELLGGLALALVLVVFMLLKREDLRNRMIRLMGHGRMTVMTKALDDAGQRVSRFLLMQFIINASFGLALAIGLFAIQVPHALLWGFLAAVLRYVPYVGTLITSLLLMTLSLAAFTGWLQPLLVLALILLLELITYNVMEPWLFSRSVGVSEVALLVAAAFWAFLWGPVGLVLSSPLTVCLVVLGRYVPQLEFLDVLLGDEPALEPDITFYQRLLARDHDEAAQLVLTRVKKFPPEQVYDELLIPALNYVKGDRERDDLTDTDELSVLRATREIVEDLGERQSAAVETANVSAEVIADPAPRKMLVLGCPGHGEADRLALEMLRHLLDPTRWELEILSMEMLSAERIALAGEKEPAVICIGALPPGGLAHTRYLCKRLRARLPAARILVGRWGLNDNKELNQEQLRAAGADEVETTLLETQKHLYAWLPILLHETETKPQRIAG